MEEKISIELRPEDVLHLACLLHHLNFRSDVKNLFEEIENTLIEQLAINTTNDQVPIIRDNASSEIDPNHFPEFIL